MANTNDNTGKAVIAILVIWIVGFFLGWLIFGIALGSYYNENTIHYDGLMKDSPNVLMFLIANLAWAILLVYILHYLAGVVTFGRGFVIALIIAFLMQVGFDLFMHGSMNLYKGGVIIVDIILNALFGGLLGGIAGWILGMRKKEVPVINRDAV